MRGRKAALTLGRYVDTKESRERIAALDAKLAEKKNGKKPTQPEQKKRNPMSAKIIDGKAVAAQCRAELKIQVEALKAEDITPGLAWCWWGEDPASQVYVRNNTRPVRSLVFTPSSTPLPENTGREELLALIAELNGRKDRWHFGAAAAARSSGSEILSAIDPEGCGRFPSAECGSYCHWRLLFCPLYAQRYSHPHR